MLVRNADQISDVSVPQRKDSTILSDYGLDVYIFNPLIILDFYKTVESFKFYSYRKKYFLGSGNSHEHPSFILKSVWNISDKCTQDTKRNMGKTFEIYHCLEFKLRKVPLGTHFMKIYHHCLQNDESREKVLLV